VSGIAELLYGEEEIQSRVRQLGETVARDYAGRSPVLISVLKGGVVFLTDLIRAVDLPLRIDFMSISKYGKEAHATGVVRILKDLDQDIGGEDVLVVEDIIDTGLTLSYLLAALEARDPASLEVCTLLDRPYRRLVEIEPRYIGFTAPDDFLVGYGFDHRQRFRNLPDIRLLAR